MAKMSKPMPHQKWVTRHTTAPTVASPKATKKKTRDAAPASSASVCTESHYRHFGIAQLTPSAEGRRMTGRPVPAHSSQSGRSAHAVKIQQASHSTGSRTYFTGDVHGTG